MSESMATAGGRDDGGVRQPIELRDVAHGVFLKVLEYLYTDTVSELTWDLGIPLLIASEQFMLDRLKALCEDRIRKEIATDNVIAVFIASHRHNAGGLKEIALEYILRNLNDPLVVLGLSELKSEPDLLVEIITRTTTSQMQWTTSDSATESASSEWAGR